jgi:copper homeostasis protein (lipoprotein)
MKRIRSTFPGIVLIAACSSPSPKDPVPAADTTAMDMVTPEMPTTWAGYYTDTLPCADCAGILTDLWVRSDSTFILQERYLGRDTIPVGTIGQWHVVQGLITIGYTGDKPYFYRYVKEGLLLVDEMGEAAETKLDYSLDKLADEIGDAIPRMRLKGVFTYMADAQSFRPCGAEFSWPCAGGLDMGEEEGEPLIDLTNVDLQRLYRRAVKTGGDPWVVEAICTMGMGPAMEGDGADEYIYIEQAPRSIERCP